MPKCRICARIAGPALFCEPHWLHPGSRGATSPASLAQCRALSFAVDASPRVQSSSHRGGGIMAERQPGLRYRVVGIRDDGSRDARYSKLSWLTAEGG